ncbi:hypothetical protein AGDE_17200 [Angomonas deanei]|uniref:Uncharacterized protein n=1 Tax=Angomonas deanei TaxID=59799 RepID=A0A7G2CN61_9TRYP|nr:hypothetical protein AGDE_17200 [Angomonas deanei]CAD2221290.1 hypothetical protein, conserved [Angomonas deanei]|eukprot:EPY15061.1 hypothetical protein AGDE_17200 [Angomonas deanei]
MRGENRRCRHSSAMLYSYKKPPSSATIAPRLSFPPHPVSPEMARPQSLAYAPPVPNRSLRYPKHLAIFGEDRRSARGSMSSGETGRMVPSRSSSPTAAYVTSEKRCALSWKGSTRRRSALFCCSR